MHILNQNMTSHPLMKSDFFGLPLLFFRPQIYGTIATILWQSASYVFFIDRYEIQLMYLIANPPPP